MRIAPAAALILAALAAAPPVAAAGPGVEIGTLTCRLKDATNLIVYKSETFACEFAGAGGGGRYDGKITGIGVDLSLKADQALVWTVLAPTLETGKAALSGTYAGVSAEAALGAGAGAKVLVGGVGNAITLQPVSVSGAVGVGAAATIEAFELSAH